MVTHKKILMLLLMNVTIYGMDAYIFPPDQMTVKELVDNYSLSELYGMEIEADPSGQETNLNAEEKEYLHSIEKAISLKEEFARNNAKKEG